MRFAKPSSALVVGCGVATKMAEGDVDAESVIDGKFTEKHSFEHNVESVENLGVILGWGEVEGVRGVWVPEGDT